MELEAYLRTITEVLVRAFSPVQIILFGSFARGDQNRASDLDLIIIASTSEAFCDRIGTALKACYAASTRLPVEALVYTPEEWDAMRRANHSFARVVGREGRILYDRQSEPDRSTTLAHTGTA